MLIDTTLLVRNPIIIKGLIDGSLKRFGGVIREAATGRIVCHLLESSNLTSKLFPLPLPPVLDGASAVTNVIGQVIINRKLNEIQNTLNQVQHILPSVLQVSQIAAGASVLNLGVSIAGFAYMGYKLNQIQAALDRVQKSMEAGFDRVEGRLECLSGQLAYLHLLVEHSRKEQQYIATAISELHRMVLIKEMADLRAEIVDRSRYPDSSVRDALKVASRVRMVLSDQAMQAKPALEGQTLLIADVATQGWAVATATEAYLLLEDGQMNEARELLALEVPRLKTVAVQWADTLLSDERSPLVTAYRFATPYFQQHISTERVERIADISSVDTSLTKEQIRRKKKNAELEFEMSYRSQFDRQWTYRQIVIAEYLDALSELSARLENLQAFATLCECRGIKSSRDILPGDDAEEGLYVLPISEEGV
ncbi:hypothetical protein [Chroococcidiopsis sp.]|uniref:hypothetical protein n=1 Tax=Chroococcidiopsis sp. TaxID=3088168 RepID=UPI003F375A05